MIIKKKKKIAAMAMPVWAFTAMAPGLRAYSRRGEKKKRLPFKK